MGRGFLSYGGITPPSTPPRSPKLNSGETIICKRILNNQPIELPPHLAIPVTNALAKLRLDPENSKTLNKELLLNSDILIGLINEIKIGLQNESPRLFAKKYGGNDCIEQAFINNKYLSPEEKEWVEKTIADYKRLVKATVAQNTPRPIAPPPSITSFAVDIKCSCNVQ